jgi:hypothetical protein
MKHEEGRVLFFLKTLRDATQLAEVSQDENPLSSWLHGDPFSG